MAASKPADRQTDIHTHMPNAVPLVWGSLRLVPISAKGLLYRVAGCPLFRGCLSIEVNGRTVGTFGIVCYIVDVCY